MWTRALPAKDFIQIDPQNGEPATEPTEVRIAFSEDAFYMGVTAFDSEPDKWLGFQRRRDEFLPSDDRFMWRIDTFLDERSGYFFEMNPSGLMADAVFGVNGMNRAWDGIWNARVRHSEIGWTIEIEIPFRTLNFDPANDTWGINFQRTVRRKNEDSIWMGWSRNQGLGRMTNAGRVTRHQRGQPGPRPGHQAVRPLHRRPLARMRAGGWNADPDAGIDFFYNPTPGLRANLTINTDFAQTEVDQRQVNLTRFSLFFPERRDFFLDGATFFDFASNNVGGEQVQPYFSRRIGLSEAATPQRIDYGTKFNGQVGAQDVGFLHVRTADERDSGFIGEEFTAARVKRRILTQSYVGGIYTRRDARGDGVGAHHTVGFDVNLSTAQFRGNENLVASGWFLRESRPDVTSGTSAFGAGVEYPNDRWTFGANAREVQANFDPGGRLRGPAQLPALQPVRQLRPAAAQQPRGAAVALHRQPHADHQPAERAGGAQRARHAAQHAVPEPGQLLHRAGSELHPARSAVRHQPRHHAAGRQQLQPSPASRSPARPPTAGCWR